MFKDSAEHKKLSSILDMLPGFVFVQGGDRDIEFCNQEFIDLFGDPTGRKCYEIFKGTRAPCKACTAEMVLETRQRHTLRIKDPVGRTFMLHHSIYEEAPGLLKVIGAGIDVSPQEAAIQALKESEGRYRHLYEHAPVMLHAIDAEGRFVHVSDRWLRHLGYDRDEVMGRKFIDFLSDAGGQLHPERAVSDLIRTKRCLDVHYRYIAKDRRPVDVFLSAVPDGNREDHNRLIFAVSIDVTQRLKAENALRRIHEELEEQVQKRTEAYLRSTEKLRQEIEERKLTEDALRRSENKYSTLVENSLTGIYIKQDGKIVFANERFCNIHGYAHREMIGIESWRLVHPSDRARVEDNSLKRLQGTKAPGQYEARGLTKDHRVIWVVRNNTRIQYKGRPAILGNLMDITPRKRIEGHLRKSEKELRMLSTRLLTAQENERKRIALELHDTVAQSLVTIKFTLGQKLKQMGSPPPADGGVTIESVINLVQSNITEVRRLMTALRPSLLDDLGILATINWHCREFQTVYENIKVEKEITVPEEAVPHELKIIIFRIVQEAMFNVAKHSDASRLFLFLNKENGLLTLSVRDNGRGFDCQQVLSDISSNRGLGLLGMRERAEQSFGTFTIESNINEGTRIRAFWQVDAPL